MGEILVLDQAAVASLLDPEELLGALRVALRRWSDGDASVPPRVAAVTPSGWVGVMPGHLPDEAVTVKMVAVFPGNERQGLPSHQALITLFDPETGRPLAILDGTHITAVRTGATSAVAADALADPGARTLAIVGAGVQGHAHLDALSRVRAFEEIRITSRNPERARALASRHPRAVAVSSVEEAVRRADVVCCCTDAHAVVLSHDWLEPGAHVSSVGSGTEVDPATVAAASVFVEWRGAVTNPPPAGATELQGLDPDAVTEIGAVLGGHRPGRRRVGELTLFKSTGHAVEDIAAAALVYRSALAQGIGVTVNL